MKLSYELKIEVKRTRILKIEELNLDKEKSFCELGYESYVIDFIIVKGQSDLCSILFYNAIYDIKSRFYYHSIFDSIIFKCKNDILDCNLIESKILEKYPGLKIKKINIIYKSCKIKKSESESESELELEPEQNTKILISEEFKKAKRFKYSNLIFFYENVKFEILFFIKKILKKLD